MEMLEGPLSAPKACVQGVGMAGEAMVREAREEEERGGRIRKERTCPLLGYVQAYTGCVRERSMRDMPLHCSLSHITC